jgi:hypothetical protein
MTVAPKGHAVKWPYYTGRWRKLRAIKLAYFPLCYACDLRGRVVVADTVDHMIPIRQGGEPFPALEGLMSLCASCHSHKTQLTDRGWRETFGRRFGGCDLDGNPIDPMDLWHAGEGGVENSKGELYRPSVANSTDSLSKCETLFTWADGELTHGA